VRTALRRLRATDRSVNAVNPATRLPNTCLERALRYRYVLNMPENGKTRDERGFEALESSSGGFVHLDRRPRPDEARDFDGDLARRPGPCHVAITLCVGITGKTFWRFFGRLGSLRA